MVWLLAQVSALPLSLGGPALVYAGTLLLAGHHYAASLRRTLRVGLENVGLVRQLTAANAIAGDINRRLESEVEERRQTEDALRRSEERFKDFAETAADWFYETDAALRYTYISERFQRISEWRAEDVLGGAGRARALPRHRGLPVHVGGPGVPGRVQHRGSFPSRRRARALPPS